MCVVDASQMCPDLANNVEQVYLGGAEQFTGLVTPVPS